MNGRSIMIRLPLFMNWHKREIELAIAVSWIAGGFLSGDRIKHDGVDL